MQIQKHRVEPTPQHSAGCSAVVEVGLTAMFHINLVNTIMFKPYWRVFLCQHVRPQSLYGSGELFRNQQMDFEDPSN